MSTQNKHTKNDLQPLPIWQSIVMFGVPALLMVISVYLLLPNFMEWGLSEYMSLFLASLIPFLGLFIAALASYRIEGGLWTRVAFQERFRLRRPKKHDWIWTAALILFTVVSYLLFLSLSKALVSSQIISLPEFTPDIINPLVENSIEDLAGGAVKGNWILVYVSFVTLFFNIFGEELWWRGYLLPRQELVHGSSTWIIHGLLWTVFHVFKYWELAAILPVSLALSFVAYKRKNTWPGIFTHLTINGLGPISILFLAIGAR